MLSTLRMRLAAELNKEVSFTTVARYLDGKLMKLIKLHPISETMNSCGDKKRRRKSALQSLQYDAESRTIVWIDVTNFNLDSSTCSAGKHQRENLHIIGAVSPDGMVGFKLKRGSYTSDCCNQWVRELLIHLGSTGVEMPVIVCDNAPCQFSLGTSVFGRAISYWDLIGARSHCR
jgi:hypothetical protein